MRWMAKAVGKNAARRTPAPSLSQRRRLNVPCTHSCSSEKMVLLTNEKTTAAAIITRPMRGMTGERQARRRDGHRRERDRDIETSRNGLLAPDQTSSPPPTSRECLARPSQRVNGLIMRPAGSMRAGGQLGAGGEPRARPHHGAAPDPQRRDVDAIGAVGGDRAGMAGETGSRADHRARLDDQQRPVERQRTRRPIDQRAGARAPEKEPQRVEAGHQPQDLLEPGQPVEHDLPLAGEPPYLVGAALLRERAAMRRAEQGDRQPAGERRQQIEPGERPQQ